MFGTTSHAIVIDEPTGIRRLLAVFAPVGRSEVFTVVVLTVNVFVLLSCYYVLKVVREPLILLGGGAELKAYASAGQALLLVAVVPAFGWLSNRVSRLRLLTTMQLIFIGCLIVFYVLAQTAAPIGLAFYLWLGIFNMLVVSNFWSFANDLYTKEQGKRLFAIIGIGASIGAIIGAFVPHVLHRVLGVYPLMLVAAGGLALSIVLYRVAERRERKDHRPDRAVDPAEVDAVEPAGERRGGFALVMNERYLRLLAAMVLVATIINSTGEYVVGKMATERSEAYATATLANSPAPAASSVSDATPAHDAKPGPAPDTASDPKAALRKAQDDYLSKFYSDYYALVNLVSFLLQALIVGRLLTGLGIRRSLFIMPLIVLGGWFALLVFANITMARIEKTAENGLDYSLHNTLRQALFLPTSRAAKYKAKAAIDSFVVRAADVIAGLGCVFVLVEVLGLGVRAFAGLNLVLAGVWLVLAHRAGRLHDQLAADRARHEDDDRARSQGDRGQER